MQIITFMSFVLFIISQLFIMMLIIITIRFLVENQMLPMVAFNIYLLEFYYILTMLFYDSFYYLFNGG
jgi:hypothetical protein